MIPDCGGIKSKAVAKVIFGFMYRWTELRNLQEPFIWMVVSCTISSATSGQKRTNACEILLYFLTHSIYTFKYKDKENSYVNWYSRNKGRKFTCNVLSNYRPNNTNTCIARLRMHNVTHGKPLLEWYTSYHQSVITRKSQH